MDVLVEAKKFGKAHTIRAFWQIFLRGMVLSGKHAIQANILRYEEL